MDLISHFTCLDVFLSYILEDYSFQFNLITQTNDPYENTKRFLMTISRLESQEPASRLSLCSQILRKRIKVGSFVKEDGQIDKIESLSSVINAPLWSHYGDLGKGVALIFDSVKLINTCKKKINFDWAIAHNGVNYPPSLKQDDFSFLINTDIIDKKTEEEYAQYCFDIAKNLYFNKDHLWSYENEYRILLYSEEENPIKVSIRESLSAIVFGSNVSKKIKSVVGAHCESASINVFFVEFDELINNYKLYPLEYV